VLVVEDPPLVVGEEHEPPDRHVPGTLVDERQRARIPPAHLRQQSRGPTGLAPRHELLRELERPLLGERERRRQHAQSQPPRAHV